MLATAQTAIDVTSLNDAAKQAVRRVFDGLEEASTVIEIPASPAAAFRQLPEQTIGVVEQGLLSVFVKNTIVGVLEPGDLLLPDAGGLSSGCDPLRYGSEQGAQVRLWSAADLNTTLQRDGARQTNWLSALVLTQSLTTRLAAVNNGEMVGGSQESEQFSSDQVIIQQGDPAHYVYYMLEGEADVLLNDRGIARGNDGRNVWHGGCTYAEPSQCDGKSENRLLGASGAHRAFFRAHPVASSRGREIIGGYG